MKLLLPLPHSNGRATGRLFTLLSTRSLPVQNGNTRKSFSPTSIPLHASQRCLHISSLFLSSPVQQLLHVTHVTPFGSLLRRPFSDIAAEKERNEPEVEIEEDPEDFIIHICEVLEEKVAPGIRVDGGDIHFSSFNHETGHLVVRLSGACESCAKATVTMRFMVERALKFYLPQIQKVTRLESAVDSELESSKMLMWGVGEKEARDKEKEEATVSEQEKSKL